MDLSYSALHTYLRYTKMVNEMSEISQKAEGYEITSCGSTLWTYLRHRQQKSICRAVLSLSSSILSVPLPHSIFLHTEDWENGEYIKELFINCREDRKSLVRSLVQMSFDKVAEMESVVYVRNMELTDDRRGPWLQFALVFYGVYNTRVSAENHRQ